MSIMKFLSRLLALAALFGIVVSVAGCSSTNNLRLGAEAPSKAKTTLAVGDRPLTVVTGEPGSSIAANSDMAVGPKRAGRSDGRVSGRVYDADGAPVPNARVRLAVSGALGGKDVQAITDRSGAFTLRGLRPGTTYTVIAEADGNEGSFIGRSQARSSDIDVRISLVADEPSPPSRVRGVSTRAKASEDEDVQEVDPGPPRIQAALNEEDLPPPVEAESMPPISNTRPAPKNRTRPGDSSGKRLGEWDRGTFDRPRSGADQDEGGSTVDPQARGTSTSQTNPVDDNDDGPNPLPPALEPPPRSRPPDAFEPPPSEEKVFVPKRTPGTWPEPEPFVFDPAHIAALTEGSETRSAIASSSFEASAPPGWPSGIISSDESASRFSVASEPRLRTLPEPITETSRPEPALPDAMPRPSVLPVPEEKPTEQRRRPTWGEVASSRAVAGLSERGTQRESGIRRTSATSKLDHPKIFCDYDERHKQLNDFRLPDLDGKLVRFKDIDADFVLIDFWGTWCPPCLNAIPHLAELQDRMKGKKVVVLGIACEREAPESAAAKVADTARRMNINYPVLLSRNDGSCPLQEALHIQAFPTMLLVDRQGRILWRDQGATATTLARLDRLLTDNVGGESGKH